MEDVKNEKQQESNSGQRKFKAVFNSDDDAFVGQLMSHYKNLFELIEAELIPKSKLTDSEVKEFNLRKSLALTNLEGSAMLVVRTTKL